MFKSNNTLVPNNVRIGWHFSSNKYAYRDVYSALKSKSNIAPAIEAPFFSFDISLTTQIIIYYMSKVLVGLGYIQCHFTQHNICHVA